MEYFFCVHIPSPEHKGVGEIQTKIQTQSAVKTFAQLLRLHSQPPSV